MGCLWIVAESFTLRLDRSPLTVAQRSVTYRRYERLVATVLLDASLLSLSGCLSLSSVQYLHSSRLDSRRHVTQTDHVTRPVMHYRCTCRH